MPAATRHFELTLLAERFAISRLAAEASIPAWATRGPFFSVTRTGDELSIVSELTRVPAGSQSQLLIRITCSSARKPSRLPSTHLARQDTPFTGAQQNDQ